MCTGVMEPVQFHEEYAREKINSDTSWQQYFRDYSHYPNRNNSVTKKVADPSMNLKKGKIKVLLEVGS